MTRTRCSRPRPPATSRTSTRRSSRSSSTRTIRRCRPRRPSAGIPADWIAAAQRSPVYELAVRHRVALPLHPEYRTLPMVWYIPPLSPVADVVHAAGYDSGRSRPGVRHHRLAADPDRVPGQPVHRGQAADTVRAVLRKLAVVRAIMRAGQLGLNLDENLPASVGASFEDLEDLYRLLAIAKYEDRYVIPPAHAEDAGRLMGQHEQLFCSLDTEGGPGMGGAGPHGIQSYQPAAPPGEDHRFRADDGRTHFNLLGWNGQDSAPGLFPGRGAS